MKIFSILLPLVLGIDWIALHKSDYSENVPNLCQQLGEVSSIQQRICKRYPKLMQAILTASKQTKKSCQVNF